MIDNPKLQHLAGWVASDGTIEADPGQGRHVGFYLKATDSPILDLFSSWFGGTVYYYESLRIHKEGPVMYKVTKWDCWDREVFDFILAGNFKQHLIEGDRSCQRRFIQGFLEGDGHVGFRKNRGGSFRLTFTNQSQTLLSEMMDHMDAYLGVVPKELHPRADNTHQVSYESRTARIIAWYLYRDAEHLRFLMPEPLVSRNGAFRQFTMIAAAVDRELQNDSSSSPFRTRNRTSNGAPC